MNVWVVTDHYDETSVYSEDTNIAEIGWIAEELSWLTGGYEQERADFLADLDSARKRGYGKATIEERLHVELTRMG